MRIFTGCGMQEKTASMCDGGSALDLFGGPMKFEKVLQICRNKREKSYI